MAAKKELVDSVHGQAIPILEPRQLLQAFQAKWCRIDAQHGKSRLVGAKESDKVSEQNESSSNLNFDSVS